MELSLQFDDVQATMEVYSFSELAGIQVLMGILATYESEHQVKTWVSNYFEKSLDKPVALGKQGSLYLRDVVKELQGVALRMTAETTAHNLNVTKDKRDGKREIPSGGTELVAAVTDAKKHITSKWKYFSCGGHFTPRFDYFTKCDNYHKAIMEKRNQQKDSLVLPPGEQEKQDAKWKERNRQKWAKKKDKDRKKKASCGAVSLVSTSSDSVNEAKSELEKQEVKVRKGRKLKKEVRVETGKEESLENKKQLHTSVSEALLKVLETLPTDTKAFLHPALSPPGASKKRESEKVPSQDQVAKRSKSSKSVAVADGVSLGHLDLMVTQLNKGIFGKMGNCSMIDKVYVPNVVLNTPSPSYGVSVAPSQYTTYVTQNKAGHGSQILFDLAARFGNVQFVPQEVGGILCMVAKVSRLSTEDMRHVSDFKLKWRERRIFKRVL
jgi:hypothetical protein